MLEKYSEEKGDGPSTIHHFYHKLFKLADNMNTKSAKEQQNSETVHFSNENKLFYNPVSDEEVIKRQLSECARVYTRSSQVMQQYREKELSER